MLRKIWIILVAVALVTVSHVTAEAKGKRQKYSPPSNPDYTEYRRGVSAYDAGDHAAALEVWLPLAEKGYALAQYAIGDMYYRGDGVDKDLEEAAKWIRGAADSWLPGALYHLGFLNLRGEGLAQDPVEAYRLMRLADTLGHRDAKTVLNRLEGSLDPDQLAAANRIESEIDFEPPVLKKNVIPEYPELAKVARLDAGVLLEVFLDAEGTVSQVQFLHTDRPNMGFDEAAIEAVSQWRYEPARYQSEPVEVYFRVYLKFTLH